MAHSTIRKWTECMETCMNENRVSPWPFGNQDFCKVFAQLLAVFRYIIWLDFSTLSDSLPHHWSESNFSNVREMISGIEFKTSDQERPLQICSVCGADIWNRFVQCSETHRKDPYVVCVGCFAEGRGCKHRTIKTMEFFQMFPMENAVADYGRAASVWNRYARSVDYINFVQISENFEEG